jgi:hypothetical protein
MLGMTSAADAALILRFGQPNATIAVGQTIDVDLILTQSGAITGTDITTNGVVMVDVELSLNSTAASVVTISPGPGFENSLVGSDPMTPLMSIQSMNAFNGVRAPVGSPTSIVLGKFTFAGNAVGTTTATTLNRAFTDFVFATNPSPNVDIDGQIFGSESFTINVTAIPEPSSIMILGASLCFCVASKLRSNLYKSRILAKL